ncbi:unnamed protein product [Closterium sp. NIES-53]
MSGGFVWLTVRPSPPLVLYELAQPLASCLLARDLADTGLDGEVCDASALRVWGSRAFVRDTSAGNISACAIPSVFLGFPPDVPGWQFYHPTSRRVFPSQDVTFDESVPFYHLFPYRSAPPPPPPLFLAPGPPPVDPLPPQGPAPSGVSQVDPLHGTVPVEGVGSGGAEPGGVEPGGAEPAGVEPGGAESEGAESRGAAPWGTTSSGGPAGALPGLSPRPEPLSPQQLREWLAHRTHLWSGAVGAGNSAAGDTRAGGVGATRLGGAGVTAGAGGTGGVAAAGPRGARTRGTGAAGSGGVGGAGAGGAAAGHPAEPGGAGAGGTGAGGAGAGGAGARDPGAVRAGAGGTCANGAGAGGAGAEDAVSSGAGAGRTMRPRPFLVPLLQQPASPLPAPSPYTEQIGGLTEHREPQSCPSSPVRAGRTSRRVPCPRPPPVLGTHAMALRPSTIPLRVPLPPPPKSSLPTVPDPESDRARVASPPVSCLLATVVTDPSFECSAASALVAKLLDFAAAYCLDYATALVAESESASPPSVGGGCALGTDVLEDRQEDFQCLAAAVPRFASMLLALEGDSDAPNIPTPRSYAEAITGPYSSLWQAAMDAEMASWKSTGTYVDAFPPSRANIVDGMWIFRVKQPPGSPPAFKVRYVARGFSQRQGVDYFQTFSPTPKMTTLRVLLHVAAQSDYELHSLDFSTAFLQSSLHEEIKLRRPPGFTGSFPVGTQWSLRQLVYGLRQAPSERHDTLRTTLAALGFTPSIADPSLFLRTETSLPPFFVLVYVHDLVFATADTEALTLVLQRFSFQFSSSQPTPLSTGHSLSAPPSDESVEPSGPYPELVGCLITSGMGLVLGGRGPVVLTGYADASWVDDSATQRSSRCEAEIYAGAMDAQELRWLTYLLTDLGEQPRSPPVLYVDNKAMIALCQEHRLEHRTKHIALRYFLARDLQQRGQLRLAYVATRANTADIFTKALPPACFAFLDLSYDHLFSPTLPMGVCQNVIVLTFV